MKLPFNYSREEISLSRQKRERRNFNIRIEEYVGGEVKIILAI